MFLKVLVFWVFFNRELSSIIHHYSMDLDIIIFFNHKPQFLIKMFLTLKSGCNIYEFKLHLNLLDICACYSCLVTIEQGVQECPLNDHVSKLMLCVHEIKNVNLV